MVGVDEYEGGRSEEACGGVSRDDIVAGGEPEREMAVCVAEGEDDERSERLSHSADEAELRPCSAAAVVHGTRRKNQPSLNMHPRGCT